ncbi:receptor/non-receptor type protein-tyrosine phosphatase, partial [Metschnikowia bicuspidata]
SSPWAFTHAVHPANRRRNRYSNVLPWDRTRVKLETLLGGSDYINALFLRLADKTYIATQGPIPPTIHHFWAMCFNQAVKDNVNTILIVMLTPLVEHDIVKCAQYWPTADEPVMRLGAGLKKENLAYGDLKLKWRASEQKEHFMVSRFSLTSGSVSKTVLHYYYGEWVDAMPPSRMGPLAALVQEIDRARKACPGLVPVIHCSAGVGRTGTLVAYDYFTGLKLLPHSEDPVFETILALREQRMMMIQTLQQYHFLYGVVEDIAAE